MAVNSLTRTDSVILQRDFFYFFIILNWLLMFQSHIFRNIEMTFLQVLALEMRPRFYLPGQIVFRRDGFKRKMIYVVSGIIEVSIADMKRKYCTI